MTEKQQEYHLRQIELKIHILCAIDQFEKDRSYEFQPYEINEILLEMVTHRNKLLLKNFYDQLNTDGLT